jgi:hypothetical protein
MINILIDTGVHTAKIQMSERLIVFQGLTQPLRPFITNIIIYTISILLESI